MGLGALQSGRLPGRPSSPGHRPGRLEVQPAALVGLGAAAMFVGVALLAPHLTGPVAHVVGVLPARLGIAGRLGRNNAAGNPKRTASTASALMIGVALVSFVSIVAASATASVIRGRGGPGRGAGDGVSGPTGGPVGRAGGGHDRVTGARAPWTTADWDDPSRSHP